MGPGLFYSQAAAAAAKAVCAGCPVRRSCLAAGEGEVGVWGGRTFNERAGHPERDRYDHLSAVPCALCGEPFRPYTYNARYCAECRATGQLTRNFGRRTA